MRQVTSLKLKLQDQSNLFLLVVLIRLLIMCIQAVQLFKQEQLLSDQIINHPFNQTKIATLLSKDNSQLFAHRVMILQ